MMLRLRGKGNGNGPVDASTGPFAFMVVKRMLSPAGTRPCRYRALPAWSTSSCSPASARLAMPLLSGSLNSPLHPRLDQLQQLEVVDEDRWNILDQDFLNAMEHVDAAPPDRPGRSRLRPARHQSQDSTTNGVRPISRRSAC